MEPGLKKLINAKLFLRPAFESKYEVTKMKSSLYVSCLVKYCLWIESTVNLENFSTKNVSNDVE